MVVQRLQPFSSIRAGVEWGLSDPAGKINKKKGIRKEMRKIRKVVNPFELTEWIRWDLNRVRPHLSRGLSFLEDRSVSSPPVRPWKEFRTRFSIVKKGLVLGWACRGSKKGLGCKRKKREWRLLERERDGRGC